MGHCRVPVVAGELARGARFDPETETFPDDAETNALLAREYRNPYAMPEQA